MVNFGTLQLFTDKNRICCDNENDSSESYLQCEYETDIDTKKILDVFIDNIYKWICDKFHKTIVFILSHKKISSTMTITSLKTNVAFLKIFIYY